MCGEYKLRVGKMFFKKRAYFATMSGIYRHQHVIQHGKCKVFALQSLHECKIETYPHTVLMSFTVICTGRKMAAPVKIYVKSQFTH